jgi:hypothetical protein
LSNNLAENAIRPVALGGRKPAGVLKSPSATIWAQSCPAWAIFQSVESPSSRPRHGRAETNWSRCHRVFASRIRLINAAKPHQCRPLRVPKARYKIHSDPISRIKPELNKRVAAQCPTCHATTNMSDTSDWKGQYFGFLNKPRWSEVRLEDARLLKEQNLPPSLYKYASFSAEVSKEEAETLGENVAGQKWTLVNLRDQVVSLRPPSYF